MICSRCHAQRYCKAECQRSHWKVHKKFCVKCTKEEAEAAAIAAAQLAEREKAQLDFGLACKKCDMTALGSLIDEGRVDNVDLPSTEVLTNVLAASLHHNNVQIVSFFLQHGFPVNHLVPTDHGEVTLLHIALLEICDVEMVRLLLSKGADANLGTPPPLFAAIFDYMLSDVQKQDNDERKLEITKLLLEAGADVLAKIPRLDESILDFVAKKIDDLNFNIVAAVLTDDRDGRRANTERAKARSTLLLRACSKSDLKRMTLLLDIGADVDTTQNSEYAQPLLVYATARGDFDAVDLLLERKANVNATDRAGCSALHFACDLEDGESRNEALCRRKLDIVRKLLAAGADFCLKDNEGETPLSSLMSSSSKIRTLFISTIMQHKYEATSYVYPLACKDCGGSSEECKMCQERKSLHKDLMWGAYVCSKDEEMSRSFICDLLQYISVFEGGGDVDEARPIDEAANVYSEKGRFPLWFAAVANRIDMASQLLACGAYVDAMTKGSDNKRETSLVAAAQGNHWGMVDLLLKHRANVNLDKRRTVLGYACLYGNFTFVEKLVNDHNADVNSGYPSPLYQALYMLFDDAVLAGKTSEERAALGLTGEMMSKEGAFFDKKERVVRFLLDKGAFIDPPPPNIETTTDPLPTLVSVGGRGGEKFLSVIAVAQKIREKHGIPLFLTLLLDEFNKRNRQESAKSEAGGETKEAC